ncbi:hypothetical protein BO94DRAFT_243260 [Aspergillus sclerotioniger CBS 115572]|uniref:Uncharacterized protein n=1 Tax=Aspergillus sclerotioniger CBS 115572 TaxID=1450535 RepID=A0A317VFT5_9EURO|nr:hypothetical protein BO94DRAFT_243260 [Aspergillus sclerotioniger CBS 115572]PWY73206.1 hypothetical protein BO94DRAFT_243260 [Aspergillus sclerotioniger CBS 115572]
MWGEELVTELSVPRGLKLRAGEVLRRSPDPGDIPTSTSRQSYVRQPHTTPELAVSPTGTYLGASLPLGTGESPRGKDQCQLSRQRAQSAAAHFGLRSHSGTSVALVSYGKNTPSESAPALRHCGTAAEPLSASHLALGFVLARQSLLPRGSFALLSTSPPHLPAAVQPRQVRLLVPLGSS